MYPIIGLIRIINDKELWDAVDYTGNEIIPFQYDEMEDLENGLIKVSFQGLYGFLDYTGKEIYPCQLKMISHRYEFSPVMCETIWLNCILAIKNSLWGCLDLKGDVICDLVFRKLIWWDGEFDAKYGSFW